MDVYNQPIPYTAQVYAFDAAVRKDVIDKSESPLDQDDCGGLRFLHFRRLLPAGRALYDLSHAPLV